MNNSDINKLIYKKMVNEGISVSRTTPNEILKKATKEALRVFLKTSNVTKEDVLNVFKKALHEIKTEFDADTRYYRSSIMFLDNFIEDLEFEYKMYGISRKIEDLISIKTYLERSISNASKSIK